MRAELQRIHKTLKATVIYVTHDQVEAMTLGQRVAVILKGKLQQVENPLVVYGNPINSFVAGFIGSPQMNFVNGTVGKKDNQYTFECHDFKLTVPDGVDHLLESYVGKEVVFGIRPEDIWDVSHSNWFSEKVILESVVDFREIIGSETYLYVHVGTTPLIGRVGGMCDVSTGSKYSIALRLTKLHFFDPVTQKAII